MLTTFCNMKIIPEIWKAWLILTHFRGSLNR